MKAVGGGFAGSGLGFLVLPINSAATSTLVHWDLAALPDGSVGVITAGEGDVVQTPAAGRDKAGANAGAEVKFIVSIEADQDGIEALGTGRVSTDHKFLGKLNAHLRPCTAAPALLVGTGETLGNNALQAVASHKRKRLLGGDLEAL